MAVADDSLLAIGGKFGDYQVVRLLGKGGMGEVYLVRDADGDEFAVKVMAERRHEARVRFAREAEASMKIHHPNLIAVYDVGEDPETRLCYITMEYVTGGSVADRLAAQGRFSAREAVAVVMQVAAALETAHRAGVVHRDIKSDNILFDGNGRPRLADLGIAKVAGDSRSTTLTSADMIVGTPAYMSPEQMMDSRKADSRSDVYSLGVVFYEMLAGQRPNADASVIELMSKAIKGEELPDVRTLAPDVPDAIAEVLSRMCAARPAMRPQSAQEVVELLRQAVFGAARPQPRMAEPAPPPEPRRIAMPSVAKLSAEKVATVLAAAIAVGAVFFALQPPPDFALKDPPSENADPNDVRPLTEIERPAVRRQTPVVKCSTPVARRPASVAKRPAPKAAATVPPAQPATPAATVPPAVVRPEPAPQDLDFERQHELKVGEHTWKFRRYGFDLAITGVSPARGVLTIPERLTVGGESLEVSAIGPRAFAGCREIVCVKVPVGVTEIGDGAFCGCEGLKRVEFAGDAPETGRNVFERTRGNLLVLVEGDSIGWDRQSVVELPERWPVGDEYARPIYRLRKDGSGHPGP